MIDRNADTVHAALAARVDGCWDRLDDVVSELVALHRVPESWIVNRVREVVESEGLTEGVAQRARS
jgi:hypothetical protein